jgi:hypothetical protein
MNVNPARSRQEGSARRRVWPKAVGDEGLLGDAGRADAVKLLFNIGNGYGLESDDTKQQYAKKAVLRHRKIGRMRGSRYTSEHGTALTSLLYSAVMIRVTGDM